MIWGGVWFMWVGVEQNITYDDIEHCRSRLYPAFEPQEGIWNIHRDIN